jgi:hypothetical protein
VAQLSPLLGSSRDAAQTAEAAVTLTVLTPDPEPDAEIVAVLQGLLAQAEAGEFVAFAYATVQSDSHNELGFFCHSRDGMALTGIVSCLLHRMHQQAAEDRQGSD